jgi:hypothetical protein
MTDRTPREILRGPTALSLGQEFRLPGARPSSEGAPRRDDQGRIALADGGTMKLSGPSERLLRPS